MEAETPSGVARVAGMEQAYRGGCLMEAKRIDLGVGVEEGG